MTFQHNQASPEMARIDVINALAFASKTSRNSARERRVYAQALNTIESEGSQIGELRACLEAIAQQSAAPDSLAAAMAAKARDVLARFPQ